MIPMLSSPILNRARAPSDAFDEHIARVLMQAAAIGDVDTVKNAVSEAGSLRLGPSAIEEYGQFYVIEYLTSLGVLSVGTAMDRAALNGHMHVLDHLQKNTVATCTVRTHDEVAIAGALEVVQWLHRNRHEGFSINALLGAAANGHVEVVDFLVYNRSELALKLELACDAACTTGQLNVVKYFVEVCHVGCSPTGFESAATSGNISLLQYLAEQAIIPPATYLLMASDLSEVGSMSLGEESSLGSLDDSDDDVEQDCKAVPSVSPSSDTPEEEIATRNRKISVDSSMASMRVEPENSEIVVMPAPAMKRESEENLAGSYGYDSNTTYFDDTLCYGPDDIPRTADGEIAYEHYRNWSPEYWRVTVERVMDNTAAAAGPEINWLQTLDWLSQNMVGRFTAVAVESAARNGNFPVLQWLWRRLLEEQKEQGGSGIAIAQIFRPQAIAAACASGNIDIAKWLASLQIQPTEEAVVHAAHAGSVAMLEWLVEQCHVAIPAETAYHAASSGRLNALMWLHSRCPFDPVIADIAAQNGHLDVIKYLSSVNIFASAQATDAALLNGHMELVQYLQDTWGAYPSQYAVRYASLPWPTHQT